MAAAIVDKIKNIRYPFSGKSFTTLTPMRAPNIMGTIKSTSNKNDCHVMVFKYM